MKVICDIEANGLTNPDQIWVIVCKDIDTGKHHIFREVTTNEEELVRFKTFATGVKLWIGHNFLEYDYPVLNRLLDFHVVDVAGCSIDTLLLSRLVDYSRVTGHSLEAYGEELGFAKGKNTYPDFFSKYSQGLENYCVRDTDLTEQVYRKYLRIISSSSWKPAIDLEQRFQLVVNDLHNNGFAFNRVRAETLLEKVTGELNELDQAIATAFPVRATGIREVHPKLTQHGTLHKGDFRWLKGGDLTEYNGGAFTRIEFIPFNASSHRQIINVLNQAGWSPTEKTQTHIDTERELNRARRGGDPGTIGTLTGRLSELKRTGWKVNEINLATLPAKAPEPARLLARRILLESRRRTLTEWLALVQDDGRIHGRFYGIGAWTHRMAHQQPNTANIPNEYELSGKVKLLGREMRQLWIAPKRRLLVGVDAEGIQLRIFAHYINDGEFTDALVRGKKDDKTDPHSLNQRILGRVCRSRAAAKRFIYALLLGAGLPKLAAILECSIPEAEEALARLLERYTGWALLKETVIPQDGKRGWFVGLDGRKVRIPGDTASNRSHLAMSGYLQNGEAVVMKRATIKWHSKLGELDAKLVNFVHDEWQTECPNNVDTALQIAKLQSDSLKEVGDELGLKCPLAGSYWNDDHHDYTIGTNWYQTH